MTSALITGIRGQDGSYLAEILHETGVEVVGTSHDHDGGWSSPSGERFDIERLDLASTTEVDELIARIQPDYVFNLAARSSSAQLFDDALATAEINALATIRFLESIRRHSPATRYCLAASSEIFAGATVSPQSETTPYAPVNAYGAAKLFAVNTVLSYRQRFGLHASSAILFNHESPRRGVEYVTRKITSTAARIAKGSDEKLQLNSLDSRRDWGYARDYADAMWKMVRHEVPQDYVLATGKTHSVGEFCELAFDRVGLDWRDHVISKPDTERRKENVELRGDNTRARTTLDWQQTLDFKGLVNLMVDADLETLDI